MSYAEAKAREVIDALQIDDDEFGREWPLPPSLAGEILRALRDAGLRIVEDR